MMQVEKEESKEPKIGVAKSICQPQDTFARTAHPLSLYDKSILMSTLNESRALLLDDSILDGPKKASNRVSWKMEQLPI